MSDREFKNRTDVNEVGLYYLHFLHQADERWHFHKTGFDQVMSLKYHIIHFIVKDMEKQLEIDKKKVKPR